MNLSGAVLAGGASRRMGTDKAILTFEGQPLWRRQESVLRGAGAEPITLVRRPGQSRPWGNKQKPAGLTVREDVFANSGPLAGVQTALAGNRMPWIAILAVDMPGIDSAWFRWLFGFCRPGIGAVARHEKAFEPLAAIYPQRALPDVLECLRRRELSLQGLAAALAASGRMAVLPLPAGERERVRSWNRPEDANLG